MPLNPPSYIGQDVWYSPDVWINQVQAALYQPPQPRGIPPGVQAALQAYTEGESLAFQDPTQAGNQIAALNQKLVAAGIIKQSDLDAAAQVRPSETTPASNKDNPAISNDTNGVQNLSAFPPSLELSRRYKLGDLTEYPGILLQGSQHWVIRKMYVNGNGPLKPGEIVANLKLLAVNVLDPILDAWPGMRITNTVRPYDQLGQHPWGQAADMQLPNNSNKHYDLAIWIQNNVPFDQLLFEKLVGGSTIVHVSYVGPGMRTASGSPKAKGDPYKVAGLNYGIPGKLVYSPGGIPKW